MSAHDDTPGQTPLIDGFGRTISYLRLSVTDRCDLRCTYCMSARPTFLPKSEVLTLEELETLCAIFIERGVTKIRITGGEPLVRRDVVKLIEHIGQWRHVTPLRELTLTTNATQLDRYADQLAASGVERINVSLDTLDADHFRRLTRIGEIDTVMRGLDAADKAGLKVKINTVALANGNAREIPDLVAWAHGRGYDLSLIEIMPMGEVDEARPDQFLSLQSVRQTLEERWTLKDVSDSTGGPARYVRVEETGGRLGFISPLTQNFCEGCNRVRLTCTGQLYLCLGQLDRVDLRAALRDGGRLAVERALDDAMQIKPRAHDFAIGTDRVAGHVPRDMAHTGG